jgi:predicted metal-dependent peptidase
MLVKKGQYSIVNKKDSLEGGEKIKNSGGPEGEIGGAVQFTKKANLMDKIPDATGETSNSAATTNDAANKGNLIKTNAKEYTGNAKSTIANKKIKLPDWSKLTAAALSTNSGSVSDQIRSMIDSSIGTTALVDWKAELKRFFDKAINKMDWVFPNRRFIARGTAIYGQKRSGVETLKTIVAAVDTSGSISEDQSKTFINEVVYLSKKYKSDKLYIIYCSDQIDNVDIVDLKRGQKPDLDKWATTGGNSCGFIPPFKYVEDERIDPSVFIYLTDTGGEMPNENKYNIKKYVKKVIWFICSPTMYNKPPFGKILFTPTGALTGND